MAVRKTCICEGNQSILQDQEWISTCMPLLNQSWHYYLVCSCRPCTYCTATSIALSPVSARMPPHWSYTREQEVIYLLNPAVQTSKWARYWHRPPNHQKWRWQAHPDKEVFWQKHASSSFSLSGLRTCTVECGVQSPFDPNGLSTIPPSTVPVSCLLQVYPCRPSEHSPLHLHSLT